MTTLREAAQEAIALICSARLCEVNSMSSRQEMLRLMIEATDTLRAALAETDGCETEDDCTQQPWCSLRKNCQRQVKPAQEPVAWQWLDTGTFRKTLPKNAEIGAWNPLYTAPKRLPLTDADITGIVDIGLQTWTLGQSAYAFARAIERAHGIE